MKKWYVTFLAVILVSCTDYVSQIEDERDEWRSAQELAALLSSSDIVKTSSSSFDVILSGDSHEKSSSSSVKSNDSSSSAVLNGDNREEPSSSSIKSIESSSGAILSSDSHEESSSSEDIVSSSSSKKDEISSSSKNVVSSSSGKASWAYLNPAISYGEMIDARDGQVYKTVVIGEQTWMAENLNFDNLYGFCLHNEKENCDIYGKLYQCFDLKTACPNGWHLPSKIEFDSLVAFVGDGSNAGKALKAKKGWDENGNGSDLVGFSALPVHETYGDGKLAEFWTSDYHCSKNVNESPFALHYNNNSAGISNDQAVDFKTFKFSVRCINDNPSGLQVSSSSMTVEESSSSTSVVPPCKTSAEDNCEYGELKDNRDGKTYKTVKIGNQWWLAENLNYGMTDSYCYLDSAKYCIEWGRLYTWTTALLACPIGTHLPAKTEFEILFETVGGQTMAGKMLKSIGGWNEQNGIDAYSFTVLPAGYKDYTGTYGVSYPGFWSSTEYGESSAYHMHLYQTSDYANLSNPHKSSAYSVRCIID